MIFSSLRLQAWGAQRGEAPSHAFPRARTQRVNHPVHLPSRAGTTRLTHHPVQGPSNRWTTRITHPTCCRGRARSRTLASSEVRPSVKARRVPKQQRECGYDTAARPVVFLRQMRCEAYPVRSRRGAAPPLSRPGRPDPAGPGSRPADSRLRRRRNSIWPFRLRSSSSAQRRRASKVAGSSRSRYDLRCAMACRPVTRRARRGAF